MKESPTRHENEEVLANWRVDASTWREFARAVRAYRARPGGYTPCHVKFPDDPPSPEGAEIVIRSDAVFIGDQIVDLRHDQPTAAALPYWLQLDVEYSECRPAFIIPVPFPPGGLVEAARVAEWFNKRIADQLSAIAEERARPTLNNRMLNLVEGHFILIALFLFFVLLPAVAGAIYLASR